MLPFAVEMGCSRAAFAAAHISKAQLKYASGDHPHSLAALDRVKASRIAARGPHGFRFLGPMDSFACCVHSRDCCACQTILVARPATAQGEGVLLLLFSPLSAPDFPNRGIAWLQSMSICPPPAMGREGQIKIESE